MSVLWFDSWWEVLLPLAVVLSTALTIFISTLPSRYSNFNEDQLKEDNFDDDDRENADRSGYTFFNRHKDSQGTLKITASVQVVVLGDIGRSPRMQYHALSIANHGGRVDLVGYVESDVHPDILANQFIQVVPIQPFPKPLQTSNKLLFLVTAPLKVLWQVWSLYYALGYRTKAKKWMLVQNPPSIPTLAVAQFVCFVRNTKLVIDWHNFGYSILALRLGAKHPLVRLSEWYEGSFCQRATAHFAVTDAMTRVLNEKWRVKAVSLHDRPPIHFQPMSNDQRSNFLRKLSETSPHAKGLASGTTRLLVSSTSWTADEDFTLLLDALVQYSSALKANPTVLPNLLVMITGKGPLKEHYLSLIRELNSGGKLSNIHVLTAWLSTADYASLLGSADLGVSLHTSSSGVDLPMKAVDMLGTGLPVLGWSKFEAWPELIHDGVNGCGFESAESLADLLKGLLSGDGAWVKKLREGALRDCERRWEDEWMPVAGQLFQLQE